MADVFEQYLKVRSNDRDDSGAGHEWTIHFVLYKTSDDNGRHCFDLYEDDGEGNGDFVCRGYKESSMLDLTLRLGTFVEWRIPAGTTP